MGFEVQITDEAFGDLDAIADFIKRQANFDIARKWFSGIVGTIETLGEMPARCALAPEAEDLQDEIRLLLHGRKNRAYRIYFKIYQETESSGSVIVFHVRHWARKPLTDEELEELTDDHLEDTNESNINNLVE